MTLGLDSYSGQVKSRLLPLSRFETILEWFVERLPRRLIQIELKLENDVVVINESKGEYKATGYLPKFEMMFTPATHLGCWCYIEAALVRNNGNREASIRAVICDEDKESVIIPIPTNLRGTVREVFYLPPNATKVYWSPTASPGFFSQSKLLLHKITVLESILRRMYRVINDLLRFRKRMQATSVGLSWLGVIRNLQDSYRHTASIRIKRLIGNDYSGYIALKDTLKDADVRRMRMEVSQFPLRPVISLIMPVQAPIAAFFKETLNSIAGQIYPDWELLLVGDFSFEAQAFAIAKEYQSKNDQIKIMTVRSGENLTAILNYGLQEARGEFFTRLNQHDQIPLHALFFLAREICNYPDAEIIYTDEDSIDETNKRFDPCFKPDWNPELFFSYNYIANLTIYRRMRVLDLEGYRAGYEGAEDYDLTLRYLRDLPATSIRHIPKILIHSRILNESNTLTTLPLQGEGRGKIAVSHQSGKRALATYFERSGVTVDDGISPCLYRIKYPLPAQPPLVSIIIPTKDRIDILDKCIKSIQMKSDYKTWEMLVVDNQSTEMATFDYLSEIQQDSRIRVLRYDLPFNYSAINNFAVEHATGEILAMLNNDVEVISHDWLSEMVSHAIRPKIGAVGAKLLYSNGTVQHAGVIIGLGGVAGHGHKHIKENEHGYCHRAVVTQNLSAVTGACLVVRKCIFLEVGGLNAENLVVALNDIDFCLKLRMAGYNNIFTPYAKLYHHESISRGHDDTQEKHALFLREFNYMKNTWGDKLKLDPAYNPNLTLEFEDFSLC